MNELRQDLADVIAKSEGARAISSRWDWLLIADSIIASGLVRPVAGATTRKLDPTPWICDTCSERGTRDYHVVGETRSRASFNPRPEFEQSEAAYTERNN